MNPLLRSLRPALVPASAAAAVLAVALTAGCSSAASSPASASSSSFSAPAVATSSSAVPTAVPSAGAASAIASAASGIASSVASAVASVTGGAVVASGGPVKPAGDAVYLAESGDPGATMWHEPKCSAACSVSGDSSTLLSDMTWPSWTGTEAVGDGTEKIDNCTPSCGGGKFYAVKVIATFTKPVHVCLNGASHWFWSKVSFVWPDGLPAPLKGADAPTNPFVFQQVTSESTSCAA